MARQIAANAPPPQKGRSHTATPHRRRRTFHLSRPPHRIRLRILGWLRRIRAISGFAMLIEVVLSALGYDEHLKLALALLTASAAAILLRALRIP